MSLDINAVKSLKDLTYKAASDLLGVKLATLYNFCKRNNIQLQKSPRGGTNATNMTDELIGSLRIIERCGSKNKLAVWKCQCPCGNIFEAIGADIRQGKTKTCGCKTSVETTRNWQGYGDIPKQQWSRIVNNVRQRSIRITVSIEELDNLWKSQNGRCALSDLPISFDEKTASLDRIKNDIGYVSGNIQWVHKDINKIKTTLSQEYFVVLCGLVHQKGLKNVTTKP